MMRLMLIGHWQWPQYEQAFAGEPLSVARFHDVAGLRTFQKVPVINAAMLAENRSILRRARSFRPDAVLFWRTTHLLPRTLARLEELGIVTVSYNNDDPYGPEAEVPTPWHHRFLWYWYKKCIPLFDMNFFYRQINCGEAMVHGAKHAEVMLPYYQPLLLSEVDTMLMSCLSGIMSPTAVVNRSLLCAVKV